MVCVALRNVSFATAKRVGRHGKAKGEADGCARRL